MKNIFKFLLLATGILFLYSSCKKTDKLPFYANGTPAVLSSSVSTIAALTADSNKAVVTFSWTNPKYATDSTNQKFIIEIDSSGRNFSKEVTFIVNGSLSKTFLAKEINAVLLGFGFAYNKPYNMDVRITSSYANNNEQYQSNVLKLAMTAYVVPPKVVPPASNTLFLVGSASAGGWDNPVPSAAQQFTRVDSVTYQGTFYMNGGKEYLLLPVNTNVWDIKYAVADKSLAGLNNGGNFAANLSDNIPGPSSTGMYTIKVDFQHGTFTVTKVKQYGLLYVPGDYQGWTPATATSIGSPLDNGNYDGYVNIPAGGTYQFKFTTAPDWSNAIGGSGVGGGSLGGGDNLAVAEGGYYRIVANTVDNTWAATKTTWGLIGTFNNYGGDVNMTFDAGSNSWKGTLDAREDGFFKFRANGGWSLNYGDYDTDGTLEVNGADIPVKAGTHLVKLYLGNAGYFTYSIQ